MLDDLKEEAIVNKVGWPFRLSTLIQKRMKALNAGAQPLVQIRGGDKMAIIIQEILRDKIYLDNSGVGAQWLRQSHDGIKTTASRVSLAGE